MVAGAKTRSAGVLGLAACADELREEILSYFAHKVANGFAEGKSSRVIAIIRAGYGHRNLAKLTQRTVVASQPIAAASAAPSVQYLTQNRISLCLDSR